MQLTSGYLQARMVQTEGKNKQHSSWLILSVQMTTLGRLYKEHKNAPCDSYKLTLDENPRPCRQLTYSAAIVERHRLSTIFPHYFITYHHFTYLHVVFISHYPNLPFIHSWPAFCLAVYLSCSRQVIFLF